MATKKERVDARESKVSDEMRELLSAINKKFKSETGNPTAVIYGENPVADVKKFSSGSLVLDGILEGGIPEGRIVEISGKEGSGKTSIALTTLGNVQKDPNARGVAFFDFEFAIDPKYAETLGVDMDSLLYVTPDYAEMGLQMIEDLVSSGLFSLIVVDSVAAMVPKVEWEGELEDQNMAVMARLMSRSLKKLAGTASRNKCTIILINQLRAKIGGWSPTGDPTITTGGKAIPFYCSQRIAVNKSEKITENGETIGNKVNLNVIKNKVGRPGGKGSTVLTYNKGINRAAEIVDPEVGIKYGVITKTGNTLSETATGEKLGVGRAKAIEFLEQNPDVFERISKALTEKLQAAEESREVIEDEPSLEELEVEG